MYDADLSTMLDRESLRVRNGAGPHDHDDDVTPAELRESAYRRGYEHGVWEIVRYLAAGGEPDGAEAFLVELSEWRYREGKWAEQPRDMEAEPPSLCRPCNDAHTARQHRGKQDR